jgi:F-type H+-transporting ATPase subunit delta
MKISKEVQAQARRLMRLCIGADGLMNEATVRLVTDKIAADKPRNYLAMLTAFTELVRLERDAHTATITSAVPLTAEEQAAITAKLNAREAGLNYEWKVDSSLIAGLTVKVGDNVTDASIRTRIEQLTKNL